MPPPCRLRAQLHFESLEDRCLLTATPTATLSNGLLVIQGTTGNDTITVRQTSGAISVDNTLIKSGLNLYPTVPAANVQKIEVHGGGGNDVIHLNSSAYAGQEPLTVPVEVWGEGTGNNQIWGSDGPCTLHAGNGSDSLYAGAYGDVLYGGAGNDLLVGGKGNDSLYGGPGNDTLDGGGGQDVLSGGGGFNIYNESFDLSAPFYKGEAVTDIRQSLSPTCQTLAALAAGVLAGYDFSKQIIHQGWANWTIILMQNNKWVPVNITFDGTWNDNDPQPAVNTNGQVLNDYWTILMQRARMKLLGVDTSQPMTQAQWDQANVNTGYLLDSVGNAIYTLTGHRTQMNFVTNITPQTLKALLDSKGMAVASTFADSSLLTPGLGLVPLHAYTVSGVYLDGTPWKIQLYNPWGVDGIGPPADGVNDGFLTLTWAAFSQSFQYINTAT
jgi:hypothetical protein